MRLAGEWNWWAPGPLRRFHDRWGISEHVDLDDERARPDGPRTAPAEVAPASPPSADDRCRWPMTPTTACPG